MYTHNLDPVLVDFGFIVIRWYSLAYIFGIILGWWFGKKIICAARLGRRLSRSVLEHTQVRQALPALAWRCGQLHVGPHLRRP